MGSRIRGLFLGLIIALGVLFGAGEPARARAQGAALQGISPRGRAEIGALLAEKASRTPQQRKMDSQLVYGAKMARGQAIAAGVPTLGVDLPMTAAGRVVVDVHAEVTDALLARFRALGIGIVSASPAYRSARLEVALNQIETIAAFDEVHFIQPMAEAVTSGRRASAGSWPAGSADAISRVRRHTIDRAALLAAVRRAVAFQDQGTSVGSVTSEGDLTHKAATARSTYNVNGTGVRIGVLSDGVTHLAASQGTGDLDTVTVVPGQTGFGDEGTAMLEIVHDLAPGAQLFFATAFNGISSFADNIRTLRNTYDCDIIIDDVFYYVESPFQDGQTAYSQTNGALVIQAVKDVTADGALYFSSAGNGGNVDSGTSGTWEGDFVDGGPTSVESGCGAGQQDCRIHNFGGQTYNVLTASGLGVMTLQWSDPLGGASDDYDLFLLDGNDGHVLKSSTNIQNGTQDPFEEFSTVNSFPVGSHVVIVKWAGNPRFLHLGTARGRLSIATTGETHGHAATTALTSFDVAATPARSPGPSPNPFTSASTIETFSSDGPRRIFFNADGSAISADLSSTGGQVLSKPDLTAADRVSVSGAGGFPTVFSGTSAAAPHAGAIAALIKSAAPSLSAGQIRAALMGSAVDVQVAGVDRDTGIGIVLADRAVASVLQPAMAVDSPLANSTVVQPIALAGWAVDRKATSGTGVDAIHVWAYPGSGSPQFVGAATYGLSRPDIGNLFGNQYTNAGFTLSVRGLAPGPYTFVVYAHSTVTGSFNQSRTVMATLPFTAPAMSLDMPSAGSALTPNFTVAGWAIDRAALSGSGVDAVHVWAYPFVNGALGSPAFLGAATLGGSRADVGTAFGAQFTNSAYALAVSRLAVGAYRIVVYAHSAVAAAFNQAVSADVTVIGPVMSLDAPLPGATVGSGFNVGGWAADLQASSGTGIDAVHVWAYPVVGGSLGTPILLGGATLGGSRPDVGAVFGPQFTNAGYNLAVSGLTSGQYRVIVYAHSAVTGTFSQSRDVTVTVR